MPLPQATPNLSATLLLCHSALNPMPQKTNPTTFSAAGSPKNLCYSATLPLCVKNFK